MSSTISVKHTVKTTLLWLLPPLTAIALSLAALQQSYQLFHMLAEFSSIVVGLLCLVLAISLLNLSENRFLVFIGIGLGWTAGLDFLHMLAYEGMGVIDQQSTNISSQIWLSARLLQAAVFLLSTWHISSKTPVSHVSYAILAYCTLSLLLIYHGYFPATFIEGEGLTSFKIYSEYLVIFIFVITAIRVSVNDNLLDNEVRRLFYLVLAFSALAELFFSQYSSSADTPNTLGHLAKILAYWCVFLAIVKYNLQRPLKLLFSSANAYYLIPDAVIVTGPTGKIIEANNAACEMVWNDRENLIGQSAHELFHERQFSEENCPVCSEIRQSVSSVITRLHINENIYLLNATKADNNNESLSSIQLIRDITEEALYQNELHKSYELLAKLSKQIPGAIYQYLLKPDGSSCFPFATNQMMDLYGFSPKELQKDASEIFKIIHKDDLQKVKDSIAESARDLSLWKLEYRIVLPNAEVVWRSGHATPEKLPDGSILWHGFITDSTAAKAMNEELKHINRELSQSVEKTLEIIENMVQLRDPYTAGHEKRVGLIAGQIARELGLSAEQCKHIVMTGMVHDIGKIAVPAEILAKPSRLTESELRLVQEHPQTGYEILKNIHFSFPLAEIVLQHHERMDGSGYPRGLKGEQIIIEARVLAVADVFESMTSHRPYRPARTFKVTMDELNSGKSSLFDAEVVDALAKLVESGSLFSGEQHDSFGELII